jgi:hypothetical protein
MSFAARLLPLFAVLAAPFSALVVTPAHAADDGYEVGNVLVCDTQAEVEQFITLFTGDPRAAIVAVNEAEHNPTACGLVEVTYLRGIRMGTVRNGDTAFQIVHVLVVAIDTGAGMQPVRPAAFFSAFGVREYAV